jgi:hypothetical protein
MRTNTRALVAASGIAAALLSPACRGGGDAGGVRDRREATIREQRASLAGDSAVVAALRTPDAPGRIIYDPPEDLSYANARATRPDLTNLDTIRARAAAAERAAAVSPPPAAAAAARKGKAPRDTTGGDAAADTSGGAARRRKP